MLKRSYVAACACAAVLAAGVVATASGAPLDAVPGKGSIERLSGSNAMFAPVQRILKTIRAERAKEVAARKREAKQEQARKHVLMYSGGGKRWALPYNVVVCESGAYHGHHSGAYGILDSTWNAWGGQKYAPYPGAATPWEQAVITAKVRDDAGPSGWSCWS